MSEKNIERPILMTGENVVSILKDRKTQTRRLVKTDLRPQSEDTYMRGFPANPKNVRMCGYYAKCDAPKGSRSVSYRVPCPYGSSCDRLWVRETFKINVLNHYIYAADLPQNKADEVDRAFGPWKPSIFMPRPASRLTLEIMSVRVERLQDISEEDAKAEGIEPSVTTYGGTILWRDYSGPDRVFGTKAILSYKSLWESINGKGSWKKNPWVWVIEFKKL